MFKLGYGQSQPNALINLLIFLFLIFFLFIDVNFKHVAIFSLNLVNNLTCIYYLY